MNARVLERPSGRSSRHPMQIGLEPLPLERLQPAVTRHEWDRLRRAVDSTAPLLAGRRVWVVNSTAVGGGVAELIRSLVPYVIGAGVDARWVVIRGNKRFFAVTKELHNQLHGHLRRPIDPGAVQIYESTLAQNAATLVPAVAPGDVVILNDPQTAGLAPPLREAGALVVWRAHVGTDQRTQVVENAWALLLPYLKAAEAFVFSRATFVPETLEARPHLVIPPSIDPTAPKNAFMPADAAAAILAHAGLVQLGAETWDRPRFTRRDGTEEAVKRCAEVLRYGAPPRLGADRLVLHLSRWDRLKDPVGVVRGFAEHVLGDLDAHLIMAGPGPASVTDDPEGRVAFSEVIRAWRRLPAVPRNRIQLALLPNEDLDENAAIVNALQCAATLVVKKSLEEGFGLGVTEAMWKGRPIVASRVGGIREQIEHEHSGLLVDDPRDLAEFGAAVRRLLVDPAGAARLGANARRRAAARFLHGRHLADWLLLTGNLIRHYAQAPEARTLSDAL